MDQNNNNGVRYCAIHSLEINNLKDDIKELKGIFKTVGNLVTQIEKIALETKYTREDFNDLATRVKDLESKPVKRYEAISLYVVTTLIGIGLGALAVFIGLK
jgi:chaperonin cofactor prefoldin